MAPQVGQKTPWVSCSFSLSPNPLNSVLGPRSGGGGAVKRSQAHQCRRSHDIWSFRHVGWSENRLLPNAKKSFMSFFLIEIAVLDSGEFFPISGRALVDIFRIWQPHWCQSFEAIVIWLSCAHSIRMSVGQARNGHFMRQLTVGRDTWLHQQQGCLRSIVRGFPTFSLISALIFFLKVWIQGGTWHLHLDFHAASKIDFKLQIVTGCSKSPTVGFPALEELSDGDRYNGHPIIDTYWGAYCNLLMGREA